MSKKPRNGNNQVLSALNELNERLDHIDDQMEAIREDATNGAMRRGAIAGAVSGTIAGCLVSTVVLLLRTKMGV
ncbi:MULTISPECIES: hypothetical protein [Xenorhabdus]|uniref:hypothetical protein n=1 Tax=Xenorhabdus TaxID=626 RepID=UPI00064B1C41|nr:MULTISPECIES: hypothetical protein [Xenorhabdus]KLU14806.1 hypothetical protein AAY47_14375 [Xenorhabdus griffiniae]KLU14822.1 hypothetical protein AAY47_14280 [Xenorhabdus griffiniae]KOP31921.1 hypothetical protein AFK69_18280 [Xenorhabdus sp. GDc328]KOP32562.1 hypothetical protein AFK69_14750 [Xenorhabdus sp. GDc328]